MAQAPHRVKLPGKQQLLMLSLPLQHLLATCHAAGVNTTGCSGLGGRALRCCAMQHLVCGLSWLDMQLIGLLFAAHIGTQVEERSGFIWLFWGDKSLPADERPPIPWAAELEDPSWKAVYGEIEFECGHWGEMARLLRGCATNSSAH